MGITENVMQLPRWQKEEIPTFHFLSLAKFLADKLCHRSSERFALVETGFTRAKNAANIMMKNLMDFAAGSLGFYILGVQLVGVGMTAVWAFGTGAAIFFALKKLGILRVSAKTELKGLDVTEHGQDAYASFQFFSNI